MDTQIKERLYISFVGLAATGLLVTGINVLINLNDIRSTALTECMKDGMYLFEFCYRKTNQEISPSLFDYLSPFLPAIILIWLSWLFKLRFQVNVEPAIPNKLRKIVFWIECIVAALGCFFPFFIVLEKSTETLSSVLIYQLFLMPWIAVSWLCIPLLIQKLLDPENKIIEFLRLRKIALAVMAAPIAAAILLISRQLLNF